MKVLQISAGPNPDLATSNSYLDAIGPGLNKLGHEVIALHMAISGAAFEKTHLSEKIKKTSEGSTIYEINLINSRVYAGRPPGSGSGTRTPLRDVFPAKRLTNLFVSILEQGKPDIIHIQNLFGLPVKLLDEIMRRRIPIVVTLHDYGPICPMANLFLNSETNCTLSRIDLKCSSCCKKSKGYSQFAVEESFNDKMSKVKAGSMHWIFLARTRNTIAFLFKMAHLFLPPKKDEYIARFDGMVTMLHAVDCLHCISNVQARRIQDATGILKNLKVLPIVPPNLTGPKFSESISLSTDVIRFCILNVQKGRADKGYNFLKKTLASLQSKRKDFLVDWYAEGEGSECIRFHGKYEQSDLDHIASQSDFCIIPSIWLETLAFTGVEMFSRGVPLVCSRRAGVSEWIEDGKTGILFEPTDPELLAEMLGGLIDEKEKAVFMKNEIRKSTRIKSFNQHVKDFESLLLSCIKDS